MNAQEILNWLEEQLMYNLGHHLVEPEGVLEQYHLTAHIRDDRRNQGTWTYTRHGFLDHIIQMKPFCMRAPDEPPLYMEGADIKYGRLLRVSTIHSILEGRTNIYVDFFGNVFNPPE